jgi:hypothetical protein
MLPPGWPPLVPLPMKGLSTNGTRPVTAAKPLVDGSGLV